MAHDPADAAGELAAKLAARSRHVCMLLGAGTSLAAGYPDVAGLRQRVLDDLTTDHPLVTSVFDDRNLEEGLSWLRRVAALLAPGQTFDAMSREEAITLDAEITRIVVEAVTAEPTTLDPYVALATFAGGGFYQRPVEVFTVNYDLLIERGLEHTAVPYFDGYIGSIHGRFRPELIDDATALPARFVRLWKLHGSVNWLEDSDLGVVRVGAPVTDGRAAAVYPSEEKYADSRRVPFVVLQDRLRRALAEAEGLLVVSGYSFGDQHLNEILFDSARQHPRSDFTVCCYSDVPAALADVALLTPNLTVLARQEAIIGGERNIWSGDPQPGVFEADEFLLGDFTRLAAFLARQHAPRGADDPAA
jgi:SIR2-like domain